MEPFSFYKLQVCTYIQQIYLILSEFFLMYFVCTFVYYVRHVSVLDNRSDAGMFFWC
jgi:hypothetical protein